MDDKILLDNRNYDEYEPTDSEEDYSEEEKEILKNVRRGKNRDNSKAEVLAFDSSDDEQSDNAEFMEDSDIEGAENDADIPDSKDWGKKARNYYNTDFVDQDYSTYNEQEEELAKQEEEEAKIIQMRLAKQMNEDDFLLEDAFPTVETKTVTSTTKSTKIKTDFSTLPKSEQLKLFQKDSPEFAGLVADFSDYINEIKELLDPVMSYVKQNDVPMIPAFDFAILYKNMMLTYCYNISFYLSLKAKRVSVRNHPVIKRLVKLKKLITELKDKYENIIRPQLEALLERINDGDKFQVLEIKTRTGVEKPKKKTKLSILDQYEEATDEDEDSKDIDDEDAMSEEEDGEEDAAIDDMNVRRGITYQMAKNKGLTPHRKKELRNPRVKHRSKFRKALIRRKGAVRTVRKETKRYGGEISGIKTGVIKSVKFKS
ncbi:something about silencing protein 10 [Teleopsis dalmanni]|uniref:something about silencing protein 10 n=1 Tax=Teleopsis dalmanni TaxID=139649 RepID=UPI0018CCC754|nr:something about silencing protein 10 [Teleopsis dalmanni]